MWVCVNNGFVSVVEDWNDPNYLIVRARRHSDLRDFMDDVKFKISYTPNNDYRYRARVGREDFEAMLVRAAKKIDYTNFKASVKDEHLSRMYHEVWYSGLQNLDPDWWIRRDFLTNAPKDSQTLYPVRSK